MEMIFGQGLDSRVEYDHQLFLLCFELEFCLEIDTLESDSREIDARKGDVGEIYSSKGMLEFFAREIYLRESDGIES